MGGAARHGIYDDAGRRRPCRGIAAAHHGGGGDPDQLLQLRQVLHLQSGNRQGRRQQRVGIRPEQRAPVHQRRCDGPHQDHVQHRIHGQRRRREQGGRARRRRALRILGLLQHLGGALSAAERPGESVRPLLRERLDAVRRRHRRFLSERRERPRYGRRLLGPVRHAEGIGRRIRRAVAQQRRGRQEQIVVRRAPDARFLGPGGGLLPERHVLRGEGPPCRGSRRAEPGFEDHGQPRCVARQEAAQRRRRHRGNGVPARQRAVGADQEPGLVWSGCLPVSPAGRHRQDPAAWQVQREEERRRFRQRRGGGRRQAQDAGIQCELSDQTVQRPGGPASCVRRTSSARPRRTRSD